MLIVCSCGNFKCFYFLVLKDTLGSTEGCCEELLYIQKKWEEVNRKKQIAMGS